LAGCAASLWSAFPDKSARQIRNAIIESADRYSNPDNEYGYGIPNFYNAYLFLRDSTPGGTPVADVVGVFPNPFSSDLRIVLFNTAAAEHTLELFDLLGRKVYSKQLYVRNKTFEVINPDVVAALQPGEYILRVDGKKEQSQRLVKVK
jgi:hypothetical protein